MLTTAGPWVVHFQHLKTTTLHWETLLYSITQWAHGTGTDFHAGISISTDEQN